MWKNKACIVCFCSDSGEQLLSDDTSLPGDRWFTPTAALSSKDKRQCDAAAAGNGVPFTRIRRVETACCVHEFTKKTIQKTGSPAAFRTKLSLTTWSGVNFSGWLHAFVEPVQSCVFRAYWSSCCGGCTYLGSFQCYSSDGVPPWLQRSPSSVFSTTLAFSVFVL